MARNIYQVYQNNPITTNEDTDLIYIGQSPYGIGDNAAITYEDFKSQFSGSGNVTTDGIALVGQIPLFSSEFNIEPSALSDSGTVFTVIYGMGSPQFIVGESGVVQTQNSILDDSGGNLLTGGNLSIGVGATPGKSLFMPTDTYNSYIPTITSSNDGSFSFFNFIADNFGFDTDPSGSLRIGGKCNLKNPNDYDYKALLSGTALDGSSDNGGAALVLIHNGSGNRQFGLTASENLLSPPDATHPIARWVMGASSIDFSIVSTDGTINLPLFFQRDYGPAQFFGKLSIGNDLPIYKVDIQDSDASLHLEDNDSIPDTPSSGIVLFSNFDTDLGKSVAYYKDSSANVIPIGGGSGSITSIDTTNYLTVDGTPGGTITTTGELSINPDYLYYSPTSFNSFFGGAGNVSITGHYNVAGGHDAGESLGSGDSNTLYGYQAGNAIDSSNANSAFGNNALAQTTGTSNNAFGSLAGYSLEDGNYNSIFGDSALGASSSDSYNSVFGYHALWISSGPYNSVFGANAFVASSGTLTGVTGLGYNIGSGVTDSSYLLLLGYNATCADSITNAAAIGANSTVAVSNAYSYGPVGTEVKHGFGTDTPIANMHVEGDFYRNGVSSLSFTPTGKHYDQSTVQTDGATSQTLITIPIPTTSAASAGSVLCAEATILAISTIGDGCAYATTSAQVYFDGSTSLPIVTFPTITFDTSGSLTLASASWAIVGTNLLLNVTGINAYFVNWISDFNYFANASGLTP